jgi:hypothetical protein
LLVVFSAIADHPLPLDDRLEDRLEPRLLVEPPDPRCDDVRFALLDDFLAVDPPDRDEDAAVFFDPLGRRPALRADVDAFCPVLLADFWADFWADLRAEDALFCVRF